MSLWTPVMRGAWRDGAGLGLGLGLRGEWEHVVIYFMPSGVEMRLRDGAVRYLS